MSQTTDTREVRNFVRKKGPEYVSALATEEERRHFEGSLYANGVPNLSLISYLVSPVSSY